MMADAAADWEALLSRDTDAARLQRGDLDALAALLARYQNRLYRYLLRLVRDPAIAEDLFQQTWVRVVEKIRRYDPRRSFEAWLFAVARNLAIDHLRRRAPESLDDAGPAGAAETPAARVASAEPGVLAGLLARERAELVAQVLAELPLIYRETLTLRFEEEMKLEEIAALLAVPLSTVKTRLRRGLEMMRHRLENLAGESSWP
jgi:RNA polymerase sigma-70 factor (ECF subfamily)